MQHWPFRPHLSEMASVAKDTAEAIYVSGFKDGFLLAATIFSILLVLFFRRGE